jgi:serine/threonine-protein kinase HipA
VELDDEGLATLLQVGTSAGGVRAKAVIAWNPKTNETRSGQVEAPEGFEYWIIKFDGVGSSDGEFTDPRGYGRVEFAYHEMAVDAGVEMSEARLLVDHAGRAHFMAKRFDRTDDGAKIHAQTLQAIAHLDYNQARGHSWEEALRVSERLCGHAATEQLFRRMVFNVVGRNQDDHTKNISFLMNSDGRWSLSPAYDVTWAYNPASTWTASHQMTIAGKTDGFEASDLIDVGSGAGVRNPKSALTEVVDVVRRWDSYAAAAGVDAAFAETIARSLRTDI